MALIITVIAHARDAQVATTYAVVDLDALPRDDARTGYPTPTILVGGADSWVWRDRRRPFFPDGVLSAANIRKRLEGLANV